MYVVLVTVMILNDMNGILRLVLELYHFSFPCVLHHVCILSVTSL